MPFVVGPWVPGLLDQAELRAGQRLLDIACGPASSCDSRRVAPGGTVTGLDLNEGMLAVPGALRSRPV